MKIALIIDLWKPVVGGSQTHVWELASRLVQNHDCRIDIFTRALIGDDGKRHSDIEEYCEGKLRVIRTDPATKLTNPWGRITTLITIALKVRSENNTQHYDLIHAHSILGGLIGKMASLLIGRPIVFTVHGALNMDRGKKNLSYLVEKIILTKIRYNDVISVGKGYLRYGNVNRAVEVIPNGIDLKKIDQVDHIPKAPFFKILFVGRLHWQKGVDTLISAIEILREEQETLIREKNVQFHLVGYGFQVKEYKVRVKNAHLTDLIIFPGKKTGRELIEEYKSSHLFILPSVCEGQPITYLEAMACRLPILTTKEADNAEIIDATIGWKVPRNSPRELAEKLVDILHSKQSTLEEKGELGYAKISQNYTLSTMTKKLLCVYEKNMLNRL